MTSSLQHDLILDAYEVELYRAEQRIATLEHEAEWHRCLARTAVATIRTMALTIDRLQDEQRTSREAIRQLQRERSELLQALPTAPPPMTEGADDIAIY